MLIIKTTGIEDYLSGGDAYVKALILGQPSAGKTRSASFWPKPIFADCEKGRMSIADRGVPYGEILSVKDMDKLLEILALECKKPVLERKYQTLVIDTLDAYQRIVIQERLDAEKKESLSGWGDWGYLDAKMTQFVAKLHALPMNIVVNVHTKDTTVGEEDSKATTTGPKLKGDLKDQIAADFDLVGFMGTYWEAEGGERVLKRGIQWATDPTKPILKDRSGQLPKWTPVTFTEDDFADLFVALTGHLDSMGSSEVLETHETDPVLSAAAPQPPRAGGPVPQSAPGPRKAAAAPAKANSGQIAEKVLAETPSSTVTTPVSNDTPQSASSAASPAVSPAVPPAASRTNVPAATRPTIPGPNAGPASEPDPANLTAVPSPPETPIDLPNEVEMTPQEVATALGGEVIAQAPAADDSATGEPVEQAAEADVAGIPEGVLYCGTGFEGAEPLATGCGRQILTEEQGGEDIKMHVEISQLKTRTSLCSSCWAAYRAAAKKGA